MDTLPPIYVGITIHSTEYGVDVLEDGYVFDLSSVVGMWNEAFNAIDGVIPWTDDGTRTEVE